jgi:hypothetical protein
MHNGQPGGARQPSAAGAAFEALGTDALPFLAGQLNAGGIRYQEWYRAVHGRLPGFVAGLLAEPADARLPQSTALELIAHIVVAERTSPTPEGESAIRGVFPALSRYLRRYLPGYGWGPDTLLLERFFLALGPTATPLVPTLIDLLESAHAKRFADPFLCEALEAIGTNAVAAVPVMTRIASDRSCTNYAKAGATLPGIGAPPSVSCRILSEYVAEWGVSRGVAYLHALVRAGPPTDLALPKLAELRGSRHNPLTRGLATLALWQRDPDDAALSGELTEMLLTGQAFVQGVLLRALQRHPDKARRLTDTFEQLAAAAGPRIARAAREVLAAIRVSDARPQPHGDGTADAG